MGNSNSDLLYNFDEDIDIVNDGEDVTVSREVEGVYRNGEYVKDLSKNKTYIARCSVQPLTGEQLLHVPENERTKRHFTVFSDFKFKINDTMTRDNQDYEIKVVNDWGSYTESIAVLIDVNQ